jgi:hypothetical protein
VFKLKLDGQRLDIAQAGWLVAKTCRFINEAALAVYRSPLLLDSDELYQPVKEFLGRHEFRVEREGIFLDASMYFGRGEWKLYVTNAQPHPDDPDAEELDVYGLLPAAEVN